MNALDRRLRLFWAGLALIAILAWLPPITRGDEPAGPGEEGEGGAKEAGEEKEASPLEEATDDQARELGAALAKVLKKKNSNDVVPALEKIEGLNHESFDKSLLKLLKHSSSLVAVKTAEMWEWRLRPKIAKKLWKASWGEKANDKRFQVKALVLRAYARAELELDKNQYKDVERDWRWMIGNPNEKYADALIEICAYFERTKDKRHCRHMAEELDDPCVGLNPNDGSTPPREWQERRWKMWKPTKAAVVTALKAITGQEFDKVAEAKAWFEANEKTFGFKW